MEMKGGKGIHKIIFKDNIRTHSPGHRSFIVDKRDSI